MGQGQYHIYLAAGEAARRPGRRRLSAPVPGHGPPHHAECGNASAGSSTRIMPLPSLIAASPEAVGVDSELLDRVFERARLEVESGSVDALQVAVCRNGQLAGMATYGECPDGQPATDSTLFSIFSCTKLTVAIAMWQLLDEQRLKLTDRVADILGACFATHGKDHVTILHLLTFTCGFPNPPTDISNPDTFGTSEQRRAAFAEWELDFAPGSAWAYHGGSAHWVMVEILSELNGADSAVRRGAGFRILKI
jgi:CubicO group peptidase (beta-lactamase class C family)